MLKKIFKTVFKMLWIALLAGFALVAVSRVVTLVYAASRSYSVQDAPVRRVAVVFGAGLQRNGLPTQILRDRVAAGAQLYFSGKVEKLLMSGDNRFVDYNEPGAMRQYALELGVPDEDIVLDYAGRRTYDTCYRARAIFGLSDVILVTQKFHLPRALYTCNMLGLRAVGVESDLEPYRRFSLAFWNTRELLANFGAFLDLYVIRPLPVLGNPEPIFPGKS